MGVFILVLIFAYSTCFCVYAQEGTKQKSEMTNLEQVKVLLDKGLQYLKKDDFVKAKSKFEEALKIAPEEMKEEVMNLVKRSDEAIKRHISTKGLIVESEERAKEITELQQNIIQFEREQKKRTYISQGKFYYEQGEYEKALSEFNKVLAVDSQDKDAISYINKTDSAIEKAKETQVKRIKEYRENARAYYRDRKYDSAVEELNKILALDPVDAETLKYMGEVKSLKVEMDEYRRLENIVNKGKEYLKDKEYEKAIQIWEQVLEEEEDYPGVETLIAQAKFGKARSEMKVVEEKYKTDREIKMLEVDRAYVPIIGGEAEIKEKESAKDPDTIAIEAIRKTIKEKKVTLEFIDTDLRTVIMFLSRRSGINMMVDEAIFGTTGEMYETGAIAGVQPAYEEEPVPIRGPMTGGPGVVSPEGPGPGGVEISAVPVSIYNITVSLLDISLMDALSLILRPKGLDYEIYPNVIFISTRDRIQYIPIEPIETRIFDLQFGYPFRGQLRPQPLTLETVTFGESSGGSDSGGGE